ncbi:MAG: diguanylate cyclase [Paraglaciecola sp.]|uniref:diguanylate cyclase domain-containing protein n=1 Tax=Paraglaciecola sp. TaxID=1920173 RepID=UPI0032985158
MIKNKSNNIVAIFLLIVVSIMSTGGGIYLIDQHYQQRAIESARKNAELVTQLVDNARRSYSQVLQKLSAKISIETGHDHVDFEYKVPNPATFSIELAKSVSTPGQRVWMYSDHPFPWRKNTAIPSNEHEVQVLAALNENSVNSIFKVVDNGEDMSAFFGRAVTMNDQSCVDCHNNHPYSAKVDWVVGDTRAVLAAESHIIYTSNYSLYGVFLIASVLSFLSIALYFRKSYEWMHSEKTNRICSLTNIPNRTALNEYITDALESNELNQTKLGVMMIDIDDFKQVNDQYGHDIGDECIVSIASEIQSFMNSENKFAGRWGGEEFQVLLSDSDREQAMATAKNILNNISKLKFSVKSIHVTVSIGLYITTPDKVTTWDSIMKRADQALLTAKQTGKNKIVEG